MLSINFIINFIILYNSFKIDIFSSSDIFQQLSHPLFKNHIVYSTGKEGEDKEENHILIVR